LHRFRIAICLSFSSLFRRFLIACSSLSHYFFIVFSSLFYRFSIAFHRFSIAFYRFLIAPFPLSLHLHTAFISFYPVRILAGGLSAVVCYTRMVQKVGGITACANETRVFEKQDGKWMCVHAHRSPLPIRK
jgi:hypothetical protein